MGTTADKLATLAATKEAIRTAINDKGVEVSTSEPFASYPEKIASIKSGGGGWTGHADAEGLKAIGWTDEDIAYYQEHGVNWDEEDDQYHKVTSDNKALYGVLTASNISTYKDRIVYLPKINTSSVTDMTSMFYECSSMVAIPVLDTSNVTNMYAMFDACSALVCVPLLNTSKVTNMFGMFYECYSLISVPEFDTKNVKDMSYMFRNCNSLVNVPPLNTQSVTTMVNMFRYCYSLANITLPNTSKVSDMSAMFGNGGYALSCAKIGKINSGISFDNSLTISKDSLLYIIKNEAATRSLYIQLPTSVYMRLSTDKDISTALQFHSRITLATV